MLKALPRYHAPAFLAWGIGFTVGGLSILGMITMTTVPAFDSMISAGLCYCLLASAQSKLRLNKSSS